ncbi:DUF4249 domain-containing protein [Ancylomarina salipaludis]|uniref:DUF4249 domain-containing protein n=1 Tax=Ancylomarina salipaludis TaxID=2501299 RepID=A0A4Q1JKQ7_9BACT|nr:DUF4249 domain-containing protein [Ancylomarina salipaludis]RXQ92999.1 DUF4249 domain-containing protein [Ancylomarina salipaludis]
MTTLRLIIILSLLISSFSCTEEFYPEIDDNASILVVDGKITNELGSCEVRLFRTVKFIEDFSLKPERDAIVILHNDKGETEVLKESEPGIYHNSTNLIQGEIGQTYWIEIQTLNGENYESIPELMHSPFDISSIYGEELEVIKEDGSKENAVGIFFDAKNPDNTSKYLRWEYRESYEWHSPFKVQTKLSDTPTEICYPTNDFNLINVFDLSDFTIKETNHLLTSKILQHEIKLEHQYLLDMSLYSITQGNYEFWENMKAIHQSNGNLYDVLPANIKGNISSCSDNCEVLGYFEASSVQTKNKLFSKNEFTVDFSDFPEECKKITIRVKDPKNRPDPTKFYILEEYVVGVTLIFIVRRVHCYECNLKYPIKKPSFWP